MKTNVGNTAATIFHRKFIFDSLAPLCQTDCVYPDFEVFQTLDFNLQFCVFFKLQCFLPFYRKALETLLHNMLMADHVSHRLVKPIVARICELKGTSDNMVSYFAEMVSEIREPITVIQKDIEEEQKRQINLKVS